MNTSRLHLQAHLRLPITALLLFGGAVVSVCSGAALHVPTTYYVSPDGNDHNPGSFSSKPFRTLQHAADAMVAGDTLIVKPGAYAGFVLGWDHPSTGTKARPIRFLADPGVIIDKRNNRTPDGIDLEEGCHWILIQGFTVTGGNGSNLTRDCIRVSGCDDVSVIGNTCNGTDTFGILSSFCKRFTAENNTCRHIRGHSNTTGHGIYVSNSAVDPVLRGNRIYENTGAGIHVNGDASQGSSGIVTGALIENNIVHDNSGGNGINCDGLQNSRIQNNLVYNEPHYGICLYRIDASAASTNNVIVNNTVVCPTGGAALRLLDQGTGNVCYNNILIGGEQGALRIADDSLTGLASDHNLVSNTITDDSNGHRESLADWQNRTGQDRRSIVCPDSLESIFIDASHGNFHLRQDSPALGAGVTRPSPHQPPERNLESHACPSPPNLGALGAGR